MPRSARTVSSPRRRKSSRAGKGGDGARPIRDDPPFSGRQRSDRPPSHHSHVVQRRPDGGAAALPQPFPRKKSDALLRAAARGSAAGRLGGLVGVLPRGSRGDCHPGSVLSQDSARPARARPQGAGRCRARRRHSAPGTRLVPAAPDRHHRLGIQGNGPHKTAGKSCHRLHGGAGHPGRDHWPSAGPDFRLPPLPRTAGRGHESSCRS